MAEAERIIRLEIAGLGIIVYSPPSAAHIREGEDYLTSSYADGPRVQRHVQAGTIVGFCTGSPGSYRLLIAFGCPKDADTRAADFRLRLGIEVTHGLVCFRDLYDLLEWTASCPADQTLELNDGFYRITLLSNLPNSGILGDDQDIAVYFEPQPALPELANLGVPTLCE